MHDVVVEGKILRWGNSYGIRIRKDELERSDLQPGQEVVMRVQRPAGRIDLSGVRFFHGGASDVAERHDAYLGQARLEEDGGDDEEGPA